MWGGVVPHSYGSMVFTRDLVVVQVLGLPSPEGYRIVMPKYLYSSGGSLWSLHGIIPLKRIIRGYGPLGLEQAIKKSKIKLKYDYFYNTRVPIIGLEDVFLAVEPRLALRNLVYSPRSPAEVEAARLICDFARIIGVPLEVLGVTGSFSMGYYHSGSDIDIVVYSPMHIEKIYDYFKSNRRIYRESSILERDFLGGVKVEPRITLSWRRGFYRLNGREIGITWIGAPYKPALHCKPVRSRKIEYSPSGKRVSRRLFIPSGQIGALLYPPCVETSEGTLVSFEYNVGDLLFRGGWFLVEGIESVDGSVIYIGTVEAPGRIIKL